MKRLIVFLTMCCLSFATIYADDDMKVVVPTSKSTNYALYPAITGVFLRLDTRDGTIQAIVPSNPKKNRVLNADPLALDKKPRRFELYPTDIGQDFPRLGKVQQHKIHGLLCLRHLSTL